MKEGEIDATASGGYLADHAGIHDRCGCGSSDLRVASQAEKMNVQVNVQKSPTENQDRKPRDVMKRKFFRSADNNDDIGRIQHNLCPNSLKSLYNVCSAL